jgi:hypothetical protein
MDKKEKIKLYKNTPHQMGVFLIENKSNHKVLVGSSKDLKASINRSKFELGFGSYRNTALQNDWNQFGEEAFDFRVLELLDPLDDPTYDPTEDLQFLENMWIEKLSPFDENGYNKKLTDNA